VDDPAVPLGCALGEVGLTFEEEEPEAVAGKLAEDGTANHPPANDRDVVGGGGIVRSKTGELGVGVEELRGRRGRAGGGNGAWDRADTLAVHRNGNIAERRAEFQSWRTGFIF
jgi:hypothetical protein